MMAHVTASALVSENKVLCHPSSTDTLSTSAGTEDHVSMGGWAARKALKVVENVQNFSRALQQYLRSRGKQSFFCPAATTGM